MDERDERGEGGEPMKPGQDDAQAVEQMAKVASAERELEEASAWVRERGGTRQVAQDVMKMTAGDYRYKPIAAALEKAGAPKWVYSLIVRDLWEWRKR